MALINCPECSKNISDQSVACPNCGFPISQASPFETAPHPLSAKNYTTIVKVNRNSKSKGVAALLAFFLGGFGIHKFYLGQILWGIIYLLFCWTFIPAIIAFFETFIILFMDESKFNRRFG